MNLPIVMLAGMTRYFRVSCYKGNSDILCAVCVVPVISAGHLQLSRLIVEICYATRVSCLQRLSEFFELCTSLLLLMIARATVVFNISANEISASRNKAR